MTQRRGVVAHPSLGLAIALLVTLALTGCGGSTGATDVSTTPAPTQSSGSTERVTFVELGSDSCVPCKEMRPVMDGIQKAFGDQVEIVFYDVWEDQAPARDAGEVGHPRSAGQRPAYSFPTLQHFATGSPRLQYFLLAMSKRRGLTLAMSTMPLVSTSTST